MICRNCNQVIDDNVKFCPYCGTPQTQESQDNTVPQNAPADEQKPTIKQTSSQYYYEQENRGSYQQERNYSQTGYYDQSTDYNQSGGYGQAGNSNPYGNTYQDPNEMINTTPYLVFAILSTICCCIPLGIPAIVFASKIGSAQQMGRMEEARNCANKAKIFSIIAAVVGVLYYIIWIILAVMGNFSYYY